MNNSDIKEVHFNDDFNIECTYFLKEGVPDEKLVKFILLMVSPDGKNPQIFQQEINLTQHFGPDYQEHTIQMSPTRATPKGIKVLGLSYQIQFSVNKAEDQDFLNSCIAWRKTVPISEAFPQLITQAQVQQRREDAKQMEDRKLTQQAQVNQKPFAAIAAAATVQSHNRVTRSRSEIDMTEQQVVSYGADASQGNLLALNPGLDEKLRQIFELMDTDGNGTVDAHEFKAFLKKGQNKTTQALLVRTMNNDKQQMNLDEFRSFFAELLRRADYTEP